MSISAKHAKEVRITSRKCHPARLLECRQKHQHQASTHAAFLKGKRRVGIRNDQGDHPGCADLPSVAITTPACIDHLGAQVRWDSDSWRSRDICTATSLSPGSGWLWSWLLPPERAAVCIRRCTTHGTSDNLAQLFCLGQRSCRDKKAPLVRPFIQNGFAHTTLVGLG